MNRLRNNPSKSVTAGPGRFITDIDYMVKDKKFLFHKQYRKKTLVSKTLRCSDFPYDCGKKLSTASSLTISYIRVQHKIVNQEIWLNQSPIAEISEIRLENYIMQNILQTLITDLPHSYSNLQSYSSPYI